VPQDIPRGEERVDHPSFIHVRRKKYFILLLLILHVKGVLCRFVSVWKDAEWWHPSSMELAFKI
jgi:hypothetical protein